MSYRNISLIVFGTMGACSLATACNYELPTAANNGGGGNGGAGTAGATSVSASVSTGSGGMGGSAGAAGMGGNAGAGGATPAEWWDNAWTRRVRITFQNAGGDVLNGFPVLVRLDEMRLPGSSGSPNGADLRFIDANGQTILPHETERWKAGGESFVWVRVPTIDATDTDHIWLYYGNPAAPNAQKPAALWNGFIGVYHLSPSPIMPVQFANSAGANPGVWIGQPGTIIPGPINDAISLNGFQFVEVGENNDDVAANINQARTAEAWVNTYQSKAQAIVYEEGQCVGWYLGMNGNGEYLGSFITDPELPLCMDSQTTEYSITAKASLAAWHYMTLVVDRPGEEMSLFVDGTFASKKTINNTEIADGNGVFRIGSDHDGGPGTYVGSIDEVRVSNVARRAGWIAAQYKSMTDKFLTFIEE